MAETPAVDWSHLPHSPEAFFGLQGDFDRKDLKRSYNALIRQFKPEKFPEEFKKIREAFEDIENRLRYGESRSTLSAGPSSAPSSWQELAREISRSTDRPASEHQSPRSSPRPAPAPAPPSLAERLETESPREIFAELRDQPDKSPFEFYALAVLSDVVQSEDPLAFLRWLLRGVKAHPADAPLARLLHTYVRSKLPLSLSARSLDLMAETIPTDRFFFLSEPLWDRIVTAVPFEKVARLLKRCESHIRDPRIHGRMTFYVHFLRRAVWVADSEWIANAFQFIDEHAIELRGELEMELEITSFLRAYAQQRERFLNGSEVRARIDAVMRAFCFGTGAEADRAVLECQLELASNSAPLMDAFNPQDNEDVPREWYTLWSWMSAEVAERMGAADDNTNPEQLWKQVRAVLRNAESATDKGLTWYLWALLGGLWLPIRLAAWASVIAAFAAAGSMLFGSTAFHIPAVIVAGIAGACAYFFWLEDRTITRWRYRWVQKLAIRCYLNIWRPSLMQHVTMTHHPFQLLLHHLEKVTTLHEPGYSSWILIFAQNDYAVAVLTLAVRFLR